MNDMTPNIGHNKPPVSLAEDFELKYKEDLDAAAEILDAATRLPRRIDDGDDETQGKVAEFIKKARALENKMDKHKDLERAPFVDVAKQIVGFFKFRTDKLEAARNVAKALSDDYLARKKAAEEKRLREEEDRRRAEAAAALKRAQDAEESKNAASRQLAEAQRLNDEAKASRAAAQTKQEIARATLDEAKALLAKIKADMLADAAEYSRKRRDGEPVDDVERSQKRADHESAIDAAKATVAHAESDLEKAREEARKAKAEQDAKDAAEADAKRQVKTAAREEQSQMAEAERHERVADRIAAKADGSGADLARTRSSHGATATLTRRWKCTLVDRNAVNIVLLAPFINEDAISAAGTKWMNNQEPENKKMPGFVMEEIEETLIV